MASEIRSEHCKTYLTPSQKAAVVEYQNKMKIESFSLAMEKLIRAGLHAENHRLKYQR